MCFHNGLMAVRCSAQTVTRADTIPAMASARKVVTHTAPTNIATIKYWGKKVGADVDPELNLPINSSVSVTLNKGQLRTITSVALGEDFSADRLWLNGK